MNLHKNAIHLKDYILASFHAPLLSQSAPFIYEDATALDELNPGLQAVPSGAFAFIKDIPLPWILCKDMQIHGYHDEYFW